MSGFREAAARSQSENAPARHTTWYPGELRLNFRRVTAAWPATRAANVDLGGWD
jgi:hypothetical protein